MEQGSKRSKSDYTLEQPREFWVILGDDEEEIGPRVVNNTCYRTREKVKRVLELYYKTNALGPQKTLFDIKGVRKTIKENAMDKEECKQIRERWEKFCNKALKNSKYPWTEIAEYYYTHIDENTEDVKRFKIVKITEES